MIKCEIFGKTTIHGPEPIVMTELSYIVTELRESLTKKYGAEIAEAKLKFVFEELSRGNESGR